jgi:hypothetical protein
MRSVRTIALRGMGLRSRMQRFPKQTAVQKTAADSSRRSLVQNALTGRAPMQLTEHVEGGDDPGVPVTAYEQRT